MAENESLQDGAHPTLGLEVAPSDVERDAEGLPVFTGEGIFRARPEAYRMALALAAEGNTLRSIARVLGVSKNTVQAILARERQGMTMEKYREAVGLRLRNSLAQALDRIEEAMGDDERMEKASPRDLAYLMKELAEKMQLFSGGATHRPGAREEREHAGDLEHLRRLQAIEADADTDADTVEVGPARGRGAAGGEDGNAGHDRTSEAQHNEKG